MRAKIYNDLNTIVHEVLEGVALASGGLIQKLPDTTVLYYPSLAQVGIVVGGGSGHEPMFSHYVGHGMANACASGYLFAAPSPDIVLAATQQADTGKGVLHLRINYAGDVMNFDVAAELAQDMGIAVQSVNITDDVASAPKDAKAERRGVAGAVLVLKAVGAAAAHEIQDLAALAALAEKANDAVRSLGVAFGPGSLPGEDKPFFDLPADEMEFGVGIHGERGVGRQKRLSADKLATMLTEEIAGDFDLDRGEEVAVLVNNLGSATMQELAVIYRRVFHCLRNKHINVYRALVGSFCSAQDMAGVSLSIMRLDDTLKRYIDAPTNALGWPERRLA